MIINKNINQIALVKMVQKVKEIGSLQEFAITIDEQPIVQFAVSPYLETDLKQLFSLSKTFTSMAIGKAYDEGLLRLDEKLVDIFPESVPSNLSDRASEVEVRHLLMMASGHSKCVMGEITRSSDVVRRFLELDFEYEPGTHFVYNNGASLVLSFIINKKTGQNIVDYLKPLFEALEIKNYYCDQIGGVCLGAAGMHIDIEAIWKFGNFLMNKGKVNGQQIISEDYINMATTKQIDTHDDRIEWNQGYGYHLWMGVDSIRCDGMLGQYSIVYPKEKMVVASQSNVNNMQTEIDIFKEFINVMYESSSVDNLQEAIDNVYPVPYQKKFDKECLEFKFKENRLGINSLVINNCDKAIELNFKGIEEYSFKAGYGHYEKSTFQASGVKANVFVGMPLFSENLITSSYYLYDQILEVVMLNHNTPLTQKVVVDFEKKTVVINNNELTYL